MKTLILTMLITTSALAKNDCKSICKVTGTIFSFGPSCEYHCDKILSQIHFVSQSAFTYFDFPREDLSYEINMSKKEVVSKAIAHCPGTLFQESGFYNDDQMIGWNRFQRTNYAFFSCQE